MGWRGLQVDTIFTRTLINDVAFVGDDVELDYSLMIDGRIHAKRHNVSRWLHQKQPYSERAIIWDRSSSVPIAETWADLRDTVAHLLGDVSESRLSGYHSSFIQLHNSDKRQADPCATYMDDVKVILILVNYTKFHISCYTILVIISY